MSFNKQNIINAFKIFWYYFVPSVFLIGLFFSMGFADKSLRSIRCQSVEINIEREKDYAFLDKKDIEELLVKQNKKPFKNMLLSDIDFFSLEKHLKNNTFVDNANIYNDLKGNIFVDVKFRKPIIRVMSIFNDNYYIDENGKKMGLSNKFTPKVLVASGYTYSNSSHRNFEMKLYHLAKFINNDKFFSALIGQIYVNFDREIKLIPRIEDLTIEFGQIENIPEKFNNLKVYYHKIIPGEGWGKYNKVDLRFKNQIVLNKKNEQ